MSTDAHMVADFYATRPGEVAAYMVRARLAAQWPDLSEQSVLGLGYAAPYLPLWQGQTRRAVALTPLQVGAARWPAHGPNASCLAAEDALPFADLSFDRVLLVHGLEAAEHARRLLREVWRVLKDDGRLMVVAPNRRGLWAHVETTPFGQGQPYSPRQIDSLLQAAMFRVERRETALFVPPSRMVLALRGARVWERVGHMLVPRFGGVTLTEAVKDVYAAVPARAVQRRRMVLAEAA